LSGVALIHHVPVELLLATEGFGEDSESLVVHEGFGQHWLSHAVEDLITKEVDRVLDDDHQVLDPLVGDDLDEGVLVIESRLTKLKISGVKNWLQISSLSDFKIAVELHVKVFEGEEDFTVWDQNRCTMSMCINPPALQSWEVNLQDMVAKDLLKTNEGISNVEVGPVIFNVSK